MLTIFIFLIVLAVLILVHELGHFLIAKAAHIRVDEFGLGFPPRLFGWRPKKSETTYSVNWIPFGGFVKIFGEDPEEAEVVGVDAERSLARKAKWIQIAVLIAGIFFNIVFAWLLISLGFLYGLPTSVSYGQKGLVDEAALTVIGVLPASNAEKAGLEGGDVIVFAEGPTRSLQGDALSVEGFQQLMSDTAGSDVTLLVRRAHGTETVHVVPEMGVHDTKAVIGVYLDLLGVIRHPFPTAFVAGARLTGVLLVNTAESLGGFIVQALSGKADLEQITGPVGIAGLIGNAAHLGFVYLISFTALISLNLAVINLIPFPALDGGRILFILIEAVKGSPIRPAVARTLNMLGFAFLLLLMAVVTYHDILRLVAQ